MRFKILILLSIILIQQKIVAQSVRVALFYSENPKNIELSILSGEYSIYVDDSIYGKFSSIECKLYYGANKILALINSDTITIYSKILFLAETKSEFNLKLLPPNISTIRSYEGSLEIRRKQSSLLAINIIELESYVAAVTEAEGGYNKPFEFYRSQGIISRTYALKNFKRHSEEGFELCDGTHCQVYKKKCSSPEIIVATNACAGQVLVNNDYELIMAAYHSNSGGTTMNSEDVWISKLSYLKSINDKYYHFGKNSVWQRVISIEQWRAFLKTKGINNTLPIDSILITNTERIAKAQINDIFFPMTEIRHYFKLPSAFFNMIAEGDSIIISGRGYGHGVGLSQESAMRMAEEGLNYKDILLYFYTGVHVVNMRTLSIYKAFIESGE